MEYNQPSGNSNKTKFIILGVVLILFCCFFSSLSASAGLILWPTSATTPPATTPPATPPATTPPATPPATTPPATTPPATTPPATTPPATTPTPVPSSQPPESTPSPTEFQSSLSPGCWKHSSSATIYKVNSQGKPCAVKDPPQYSKICGPQWSSHKTTGSLSNIYGTMSPGDVPRCTDSS